MLTLLEKNLRALRLTLVRSSVEEPVVVKLQVRLSDCSEVDGLDRLNEGWNQGHESDEVDNDRDRPECYRGP